MTPCPICDLSHHNSGDMDYCIPALIGEVVRLTAELVSSRLRERAALGQATLARQSAHELGDKLRETQETVRNLQMMIDKDLK